MRAIPRRTEAGATDGAGASPWRSAGWRTRLGVGVALAALLGLGCGSEEVVAPDDGGNGPSGDRPLEVFSVALRPAAILRPSNAGPVPTPQLLDYYATAFYQGGAPVAQFNWLFDPALGEIGPKHRDLSIHDPTVVLHANVQAPLGFYDLVAAGSAPGGEVDTAFARVAVVENTWMKHARPFPPGDAPAIFESSPLLVPGTGGIEEIYYIESPTGGTVNLRLIDADPPLNAAEQTPRPVFIPPPNLVSNQVNVAAEATPDLSPPSWGREELLFSSQMDPQYRQRCPNVASCGEVVPFRLWVVRRPSIVPNSPRSLTSDSTFIAPGDRVTWYRFNYLQPRWNPLASGNRAQVAFISNLGGDGRTDLWLAEIVDKNADARSDTLENFVRLTTAGGVTSLSWHPDGQHIYYTASARLFRLNVNAPGAAERIDLYGLTSSTDTLAVEGIANVDVFKGSASPLLIAFQANLTEETTRDLYVYNETDHVLSRVLPFPFMTSHSPFPRWHPTQRRIAYVCDYTVQAWTTDRLAEPVAERFGMLRTQFPSVWVVSLED